MVLNLTPSIPTPVTPGRFSPIAGVNVPQSIAALGDLTDVQRSTNLANRATGGGAAGAGFAGEQLGSNTVNYMANLLLNRIAPTGTPVEENVQRAFKPIELQYLRQLGLQGNTTSEIFKELGLGQALESGFNGQADSPAGETIRNNILRSLTERQKGVHEGGDRNVGGPQFGGSRIAPGGTSVTGDEVGAGALIAGALTNPVLGAVGALGSLGVGTSEALKDAFGVQGVLGPTRPQVGTPEFDAVVNAGDRDAGGGTSPGSPGGTGRSPGGVGSSHPGARADRDHDSGGGRGGGGSSGGGGGFAHGGLIRHGYAAGGEIEGNPGMALADVLGGVPGGGDPSFTPRPAGAGPDDVSITAQQGEYVIAKPAIQALGVDFFNVLNDIFLKNPGLDPKAGLKAASAVIKVPESDTSVAQPGQNIGEQIGAAIPGPGGPFASGGLIGARPVSV